MQKVLNDNGVPILQAKPGTGRLGKGHAEAAAAALREAPAQQRAVLGGQMRDVRGATETTRACSDQCGEDFTDFLDNGTKIKQGDRGWMNREVVTEGLYTQIYNGYGNEALGQPAFHNIIHYYQSLTPSIEGGDGRGGMGAIEGGGGAEEEH